MGLYEKDDGNDWSYIASSFVNRENSCASLTKISRVDGNGKQKDESEGTTSPKDNRSPKL